MPAAPADPARDDPAAAGATADPRQVGIDLARYVAFVGMVLVNFGIVMGVQNGPAWQLAIFDAVPGRAAALFVVLAGIGLGFVAARTSRATVLRRGLFLFAIGLGNALIFSGDILHFYGVWFALACIVMRWRTPRLLALATALVAASATLVLTLDYERGWDWQTLEYTDFWTWNGMLRHLFYNGWHPVLPWFAFLLLGLALARCELSRRRVQWILLASGAAVAAAAHFASHRLLHAAAGWQWPQDLATAAFGTSSIPPMPLYVLSAGGTAVAVLGLCLLVGDSRPGAIRWLLPAGRQTLSLYLAHIVIGMSVLDELGMLGDQPAGRALVAALLFCAAATAFAWLWSRRFRRGPVEAVMRRLTG